MNYITYKDIDGKIGINFKVKQYDIVTVNVGLWKDKLALVTYIREPEREVKVRVIENGIDLTLKIKNVTFVNHNTRHSAKSYIELCDKMKANFIAKYRNKDYIINHWNTDPMIINDIVADTIANGAGIYIGDPRGSKYNAKAVIWLTEISDYITMLLRYGNFDFVINAVKGKESINDETFNLINKLHNYFFG